MVRINDRDGLTRDYRGLLVAEITAVRTPSAGPLAGRRVYSWTEQTLTPADGGYEAADPARRGVYTSPTDFDGVLLDANDTLFDVGQYVWARLLGYVGGRTVYETVAATAATPAPDGTPLSNCLAAFVGWLEADCLRVTVLQGADPGACSNITTVTLDATSPGGYVWTTDGTFEVPGGDATIEIYKKADGSPGATIHVWTGTAFESIEGVYVGCSGSSLEFAFPADPLLCDDEGVACGDNTVRVRAACITCPEDTCETTCDCAECPDGAPGSYTFTLAGGTDDFTGANGAWSLCLNAETCAWEAPRRRGGWNAVYTRVGTVGTLTLEYGGLGSGLYLTYQIDPVATDCFDPNALSAVDAGGTGSIPGAPTLTTPDTPIVCPTVDVLCCDPILLPETKTLTFGGGFSAYGPVVLTWNSGTSVSPGNPGSWLLELTFVDCGYTAATGTSVVCSPFSASASGSLASPPPCDLGAWTATITE